eukprot:6792888-Prymnesium_polylepis.1
MDARISIDEQITPALLAEESLTMGSPVFSKSAKRASGVRKRLAPSTITFALGVPSARRKSCQLEPFIVAGRPPDGTKASATTRLCIVLRAATPAGVSVRASKPLVPSFAGSSADRGSEEWKRRSSSSIGRPSGSSADAVPSAKPTTRTLVP